MTHVRKTTVALVLLSVMCFSSPTLGIIGVSDFGSWPEDWPKELEPLRKQARTIDVAIGIQESIYAIRFSDRATFERCWPVLCQVKSKGAPLKIYSVGSAAPTVASSNKAAAVRIHAPARGMSGSLAIGPPWPAAALLPDGQLPEYVEHVGDTWVPAAAGKPFFFHFRARVDLELVVDGKVIDLNRIPLPADTPIVDTRAAPEPEKDQKETNRETTP